jgi:hypothetical protein
MTLDADEAAGGTWLRTAATWLAVASVLLVLVNAGLVLRNQGSQRVVNQRQQTINQAVQLARAGQILVQTVARVAVATKDDALTAALEHQGIKLNVPATGDKPGEKPGEKP